ncbi:DMT family transporter [Terasakiella sp. SH-1]|uniref:DMT family transporter n=1 Tax=Terasakiella sp. SH-1 TaxID=2560057 RepID=UPI0010731EB5|nr:DMT family transporter [Terasakiella sp. SH-1]
MSSPNSLRVYLIAGLGILIWGASPAATKLAVQSFSAMEAAVFRTFLAALLILPFALFKRLPLPKNRTDWFALAIACLLGTIGYALLFSMGMTQTSTIHAALIIASAPIFTGLIGFSVEKNWPRSLWWMGAGVAFIGEIYLILSQQKETSSATLQGDLLVFLSILCVSAGYVAGGRLSAAIGTWAATAWTLVFSGLLLLPLFIPLSLNLDPSLIQPSAWWAMAYLVIFICILGYVCWFWAIGECGVGPIAPLQFAQPIVSIALAISFLSESLTLEIAISTIAILAGIMITRRA